MLRARTAGALPAAAAGLLLAACGVATAHAAGQTTTARTSTSTSTTSTSTAPTTTSSTTTSTTTTTVPPTTTEPRSLGVGIVQVVLVNPNGYAHDYATGGEMPRTLVTEIRYPAWSSAGSGEIPAAPPASAGAPYPVVVFAHGYDVTPDAYAPLLDAWTRAGYVVVAPLFPDENGREVGALGGPGSYAGSAAESDVVNEPSDLAYLVDTVAEDARRPAASAARVLYRLVDPTRLVLAGQSDGAEAVAALAFDDYYASYWDSLSVYPRVVASLSGAEFARSVDHYVPPRHTPLLVVAQSASDECNFPQYSTQLYNALPGPKWFLEIFQATHLGPYSGVGAAAPLMESVTAELFDAALGRPGATDGQAVAMVRRSGLGVLSASSEAPYIPPFYPSNGYQVAEACAAP